MTPVDLNELRLVYAESACAEDAEVLALLDAFALAWDDVDDFDTIQAIRALVTPEGNTE